MSDDTTDSAFGPLIQTSVRIATWNLWWRFGPWEDRLPRIEAVLRDLDADVICLQEVWIDLATGESSASRLAEALGYHHVTANRADLDGTGFANAVLARWPITGQEWRPLSSPPELEEYRLVLRADVDGPRGSLQVFTTHLHWRMDHSHIRQQQVRELCTFVDESPDRSFPAVLCGDFNADPDSDEIRMVLGKAAVPTPGLVFHDTWRVATADPHTGVVPPGDTWSNRNTWAAGDLEPGRRIDYVFAGWPKAGGAGHAVDARLVGTEPVDGVWPSDHFGVAADLRY